LRLIDWLTRQTMTDQQLYLAIGAPMLFNAVLIGLLVAYINARIGGVNARIESLESRLENLATRLNQRFDEMRDLWRAELYRVEGVIHARLKHLAESR
jgi:hypothetical protein